MLWGKSWGIWQWSAPVFYICPCACLKSMNCVLCVVFTTASFTSDLLTAAPLPPPRCTFSNYMVLGTLCDRIPLCLSACPIQNLVPRNTHNAYPSHWIHMCHDLYLPQISTCWHWHNTLEQKDVHIVQDQKCAMTKTLDNLFFLFSKESQVVTCTENVAMIWNKKNLAVCKLFNN